MQRTVSYNGTTIPPRRQPCALAQPDGPHRGGITGLTLWARGRNQTGARWYRVYCTCSAGRSQDNSRLVGGTEAEEVELRHQSGPKKKKKGGGRRMKKVDRDRSLWPFNRSSSKVIFQGTTQPAIRLRADVNERTNLSRKEIALSSPCVGKTTLSAEIVVCSKLLATTNIRKENGGGEKGVEEEERPMGLLATTPIRKRPVENIAPACERRRISVLACQSSGRNERYQKRRIVAGDFLIAKGKGFFIPTTKPSNSMTTIFGASAGSRRGNPHGPPYGRGTNKGHSSTSTPAMNTSGTGPILWFGKHIRGVWLPVVGGSGRPEPTPAPPHDLLTSKIFFLLYS